MAENRRGKENRFYFNRGQMVLLGAAFVFASVIIFALGVFVGKNIEGRKLFKPEEPLVKLPVKPAAQEPAAATPLAPKNEITFNDGLPRSAAAAALEAPPRSEKPLQTAAKENLKGEAARNREKSTEKSATAGDSAKKPEAKNAGDAAEAGKVWRAQVNAFPDDRSAKQIVDRLRNKGYNAYVTEVENRGRTWYRVNVGKYQTREEADKVAEVLRTKENYTKAFVATR
jgi:cell division septation protein DedD